MRRICWLTEDDDTDAAVDGTRRISATLMAGVSSQFQRISVVRDPGQLKLKLEASELGPPVVTVGVGRQWGVALVRDRLPRQRCTILACKMI